MAGPVPDDLFAQFALQHVLATPVQLEEARTLQAGRVAAGEPLSLAEALVRTGAITAAQREGAEQRLLARQQGGIKQLAHYRLLRKLGEGAMGSVYLAEDVNSPGRKVALKVLPRQHGARADLVKRFEREADAAGRLNHPHIARAFSFAEDQGWMFYVMEYCEGETLDARLKRGEVFGWAEAVQVAIQVARGLKYAHELGFVHRDIKPSNIMVARDGGVKILDFGLAKNVEDLDSSFRTQSGVAIGTPHYMSPEQAKGASVLDGRADLYALGASVYHCVTGRTPYEGSTVAEVVGRHLGGALADPRAVRADVPDGVARVIRRMMEKDPKDRYRSCGDLLADLERVAAGQAPQGAAPARSLPAAAAASRSRAASSSPRPGEHRGASHAPARRERGSRRTLAFAAGGAAAVAILLLFLLDSGGDRKPPRPSGPVPAPVPPRASVPAPVPEPPDAVKPSPTPAAGPLREIREGSARRQLDDLRGLEQDGELGLEDLVRRFRGFVESYGDTAAGREGSDLLDRLKARAAAQPPAPPSPPAPVAVKAPPAPADPDVVDPARWSGALDLLPRVDPAQDTVGGAWEARDGGLVSNNASRARIEIPYEPPEAYDVRAELTRLSGGASMAVYFWKDGRRFRCILGMPGGVMGFGLIDGKRCTENPTGVRMPGGGTKTGHRYVLVVKVRNDALEAWLDGERLVQWKPDYARCSIHADSDMKRGGVLGLYSYASPTHFHRVQVREVTGKGTFLRP